MGSAAVQQGPLSLPISCRSAHQAQLPRLRLGHGELDRPYSSHLEVQVAWWGGPRRAERPCPCPCRSGQKDGEAVTGRVGHERILRGHGVIATPTQRT